MGFLDTLSRVAGAAMEKMEDINEQMDRYMREYDRLSDEQLVQRFRRESGMWKVACMNVIKSRGYQDYMENYDFLDDGELVRKYRESSGIEKLACENLLRKRKAERNG